MKTLDPNETAKENRKNQKLAQSVLFQRELETDTLARTIWGEARGEGTAGMQAVANIIMNRLKVAKDKGGFWWGSDIIAICHKPFQFSTWNHDDPNRQKALNITEEDIYFITAKRLARRAVYNVLPDITKGADHYHVTGITPIWTKGEKPIHVIGNHIFYKLV